MEPQPSQTDPVGTKLKRLELVSPAEGAHSSGRVRGVLGGSEAPEGANRRSADPCGFDAAAEWRRARCLRARSV